MPPPLANHRILSNLNDAQRRAVSSNAATVAILAGPGSGKTHTLTSRVVWLIDHVGYRPEDVIVATFTVKAAREMKERIGKALGDGREKKIVLGNFHSIARRYLAAYGRKIGINQKFGIADDGDSRSLIARICKRKEVTLDPVAVRAWISKKKAKGNEVDAKPVGQKAIKTAGEKDLEECYNEYQAHLKKSNLLDFDDLLVRCVELLREFPSCVSNIQTVLIDEYQDTNGIQYELMKLFAQRHKRITIVGDPDQSIYGWRSAEIQNLWRMLKDFPGTDEISLEQNYRSLDAILKLSLLVIQQDKKRYQKALKPVHGRGSRPVLRRLKSASAEADWIVSEIRRVIMMSGSMLTFNDVAILLRSASLSRHVESALGKSGIAYRMVGGKKFYERLEIKAILDYLRVIYQPGNNDALARIINVPKRGVGDVTIKSLLEEAESSSLSVWTILTKHCRGDRTAKTKIPKPMEQRIAAGLTRPLDNIRRKMEEAAKPGGVAFGLVEIVEQLLAALNFQKHLQDTHPDDHEQRWANVEEFVTLAGDFVRDLNESSADELLPEIEGLEQSKEDEVLPRFLANVSLASDAQTGEGKENKPLVTISTIHAAKGLEWPVVFVPAVYNGSIPHMRSDDNDEERRLLYVAMTRAQSLLYLSCPLFSTNGNGERNQLSSFVEPVHRAFATKGPCFDRPVMLEIAKVLGRTLPTEDAVFKALPSMFNPEDNLFPVDPEESQEVPAGGAEGRTSHRDAPRAKRPRLSNMYGGQNAGEDVQWHRDYTTTMEAASSFTVLALPGFVSAGTHQAAITAANAAAVARQQAEQVKKLANRRPPNQKSILGFVKSTSSSSFDHTLLPSARNSVPAQTSVAPPQVTANPGQQAIPTSLATHKPAKGTLLSRPSRPAPAPDETPKGKAYPCFSSSPVKPDSIKPDPEEENDEPPPEPTRVAACLHSTTFTRPTLLTAGKGAGGLTRPSPVSKFGRTPIAPIDRLRKPFKPLTIKRP
ncbi:P-loop containing nucleoside triphosphate hydrolase protein [Triangularia setosa]|uniref:DNA 3'-5' helicase n=1 Tax=Triangularia setosa TaxID=2587417 RepID=A0AAN6WD27_9PEZI|nr:P-loop containing nucleoside triphosphate hydrolase protein [Podospora setosa]